MDQVLDDLKMRFVLNRDMIFYTTVMYSLELELSDEIPTACTNGKYIKFNPTFLGSLNPKEQEFLLAHEIMHVALEHMFRIGDRDIENWNIANDHVINLELLDLNMQMPEGGDADPQYTGMSSEEVYPLLPPAPENFVSDVIPNPSDDAREEVKDILIQAVQQARMQKQAGAVPESIQRKVDEWLNPVLPWFTILQKYMSAHAREDYSWSKKNLLIRDRYLPSLYSEQVGPIHFFIDGSCSVSDEMFSLQVNQIKWIKKNLNPSEIRIIVFNTRIVDTFVFNEHEAINVDFSARGGTDIRDIVTYMEKHKAEANIIFTDGFFTPVEMKHIPEHIWCIYDNPNFKYKSGKVIFIPPQK